MPAVGSGTSNRYDLIRRPSAQDVASVPRRLGGRAVEVEYLYRTNKFIVRDANLGG